MVAQQDTAAKTPKTGGRLPAILFELENVAFDGRQVVYDAVKSVLKAKDAELTPLLFATLCVDRPPEVYLDALLKKIDKTRMSKANLAAEIEAATAKSFSAANLKPASAANHLVAAALAKGMAVGTLSILGEALAQPLIDKLGGAEKIGAAITGVSVFGESPGSSQWGRLALKLQTSARKCVAVVTSRASFASAIAAGMRCVVIPNRFTQDVDFSGADAVIDELDSGAASMILGLLEPPAWQRR